VCLESIAFACGEPPQHLRLKSLTELQQGTSCPDVTLQWKSFDGRTLTLQSTLNAKQGRCALFRAVRGHVPRCCPDSRAHSAVQCCDHDASTDGRSCGPVTAHPHPDRTLHTCRIFRLNGKLATRAVVRQELLKQHVFGEFSFVRQAQVAELVQSSSAAALAGIISGASQSTWHVTGCLLL
jgi:hypothetical protein